MKLFEKTPCLVAEFQNFDQFLEAISNCSKSGIKILEVFSPFPVDVPGNRFKNSQGIWAGVGFISGLVVAAALVLLTQYSFPLYFSQSRQLTFFIPAIFVIGLLFSGLFIWIRFRLSNQLLPGQKPHLLSKRATCNRICLVAAENPITSAIFDTWQKEEMADVHRDILIRQLKNIPIPIKHLA